MFKVFRTSPDATLPVKGSKYAAGYDLSSIENVVILPGERACVATGLKIQLPRGWYGRIAPRSGLAVSKGIHIGAGVIDEDYLGKIGIVVFNLGQTPFEIITGMKIAQLIFERYGDFGVQEVLTEEELGKTERGEGGFGSTGLTGMSNGTPLRVYGAMMTAENVISMKSTSASQISGPGPKLTPIGDGEQGFSYF